LIQPANATMYFNDLIGRHILFVILSER
jgi:hypothetical protein